MGASGSGKTTLLLFLARLSGKTVSYMAQTDLLLPWLTILDNVSLGALLRGEPQNQDKALEMLKAVGLGNYAQQYPHQLSVGMRQRVALARTLMEDRDLILMDEPFSALDTKTKTELQEYAVKTLQGKTILLVTHDVSDVIRLAEVIYILKGTPSKAHRVAEMESLLSSAPTPRPLENQALWQNATQFLHSLYT